MDDELFAASYPNIWNFLDSTLWPDVDSYNLFVMLHRVMKHGHPDGTAQLVEEFKRLSGDDRVDASRLADLFGRELPPIYQVVNIQNAKQMIYTLAEYLEYLRDVEGVRGTPRPW